MNRQLVLLPLLAVSMVSANPQEAQNEFLRYVRKLRARFASREMDSMVGRLSSCSNTQDADGSCKKLLKHLGRNGDLRGLVRKTVWAAAEARRSDPKLLIKEEECLQKKLQRRTKKLRFLASHTFVDEDTSVDEKIKRPIKKCSLGSIGECDNLRRFFCSQIKDQSKEAQSACIMVKKMLSGASRMDSIKKQLKSFDD